MNRRGAFFCLLFIAGFLSFFTRKDATPASRNQADYKTIIRRDNKALRPKLRAGGWFVNADILVASHVDIEARFQTLRQLGIQQRLREQTGEEKSLPAIAAELAELEKTDGDQPLQLDIDLSLLRPAGFRAVDCFWKETREAVWGGMK